METGERNATARDRAGRTGSQREPERREEGRGEVERVLHRLQIEVGESQFERYFGGQTRLSLGDHTLDVTVPSGFLAEMLSRRFGEHLRRAAGSAGEGELEVRFRVDRGAFDRAAPSERSSASHAPSPTPQASRAPVLQPRHRFETFLVGISNRLAVAAARRCAEEAEAPLLFLHGVSGVGKTHLLQSVAARFQELHPGARVRYTTAEAFTNEFIVALKSGRLDSFRASYRRVDLLCLDDVHFFSNKDATQNELLFTFDAIGLEGARVAMASDEHPREIRKLHQRLVSRFLAGAVVKIELPDLELREKLIRRFALDRRMKLDDDAVRLLVDRSARGAGSLNGCAGSVREIEGLLNQVDAMNRILPELGLPTPANGVISASIVRRALGLDVEPGSGTPTPARIRRPVMVESVIAEVCRTLCVDLGEFMGKGRHKRVVLARSLVASLSRRLTTMSFPEIARAMGRGNHSTVITAQKRLDKEIASPGGGAIEPGLLPGMTVSSLRDLADALADQITRTGR